MSIQEKMNMLESYIVKLERRNAEKRRHFYDTVTDETKNPFLCNVKKPEHKYHYASTRKLPEIPQEENNGNNYRPQKENNGNNYQPPQKEDNGKNYQPQEENNGNNYQPQLPDKNKNDQSPKKQNVYELRKSGSLSTLPITADNE